MMTFLEVSEAAGRARPTGGPCIPPDWATVDSDDNCSQVAAAEREPNPLPSAVPTCPPEATTTVRNLAEILADPPRSRSWLVNELLRAGGRCVMAGPRGMGKSWLAMQLADTLSSGADFLGFTCSPSVVLMLLGESSDDAVAGRWQTFGGPSEPARIHVDTSRSSHVEVGRVWWESETRDGQPCRREGHEAIIAPALERDIKSRGVQVLIIDPWATFYRGDENSNGAVECALNELADLQTRTGVAVILVHHFGKDARANAEPEDAWRGASRLADWAATRMTLTAQHRPSSQRARNDRHDARRFVRLSFLTRDAASPADVCLEADPESRRFKVSDSSAQLDNKAQQVQADARHAAQVCIDNEGFASDSEAGKALKLDPRTAAKHLAIAEQMGLGVVSHGAGGRGNRRSWLPAVRTPAS